MLGNITDTLKRIVCDYILKEICGKFIKTNISSDELKVKRLEGSAQITNIELDTNYINSLIRQKTTNLFIKYGKIEYIDVIIPWRNLSSSPTKIRIKGVLLECGIKAQNDINSLLLSLSTAMCGVGQFFEEELVNPKLSFDATKIGGLKMFTSVLQSIIYGAIIEFENVSISLNFFVENCNNFLILETEKIQIINEKVDNNNQNEGKNLYKQILFYGLKIFFNSIKDDCENMVEYDVDKSTSFEEESENVEMDVGILIFYIPSNKCFKILMESDEKFNYLMMDVYIDTASVILFPYVLSIFNTFASSLSSSDVHGFSLYSASDTGTECDTKWKNPVTDKANKIEEKFDCSIKFCVNQFSLIIAENDMELDSIENEELLNCHETAIRNFLNFREKENLNEIEKKVFSYGSFLQMALTSVQFQIIYSHDSISMNLSLKNFEIYEFVQTDNKIVINEIIKPNKDSDFDTNVILFHIVCHNKINDSSIYGKKCDFSLKFLQQMNVTFDYNIITRLSRLLNIFSNSDIEIKNNTKNQDSFFIQIDFVKIYINLAIPSLKTETDFLDLYIDELTIIYLNNPSCRNNCFDLIFTNLHCDYVFKEKKLNFFNISCLNGKNKIKIVTKNEKNLKNFDYMKYPNYPFNINSRNCNGNVITVPTSFDEICCYQKDILYSTSLFFKISLSKINSFAVYYSLIPEIIQNIDQTSNVLEKKLSNLENLENFLISCKDSNIDAISSFSEQSDSELNLNWKIIIEDVGNIPRKYSHNHVQLEDSATIFKNINLRKFKKKHPMFIFAFKLIYQDKPSFSDITLATNVYNSLITSHESMSIYKFIQMLITFFDTSDINTSLYTVPDSVTKCNFTFNNIRMHLSYPNLKIKIFLVSNFASISTNVTLEDNSFVLKFIFEDLAMHMSLIEKNDSNILKVASVGHLSISIHFNYIDGTNYKLQIYLSNDLLSICCCLDTIGLLRQLICHVFEIKVETEPKSNDKEKHDTQLPKCENETKTNIIFDSNEEYNSDSSSEQSSKDEYDNVDSTYEIPTRDDLKNAQLQSMEELIKCFVSPDITFIENFMETSLNSYSLNEYSPSKNADLSINLSSFSLVLTLFDGNDFPVSNRNNNLSVGLKVMGIKLLYEKYDPVPASVLNLVKLSIDDIQIIDNNPSSSVSIILSKCPVRNQSKISNCQIFTMKYQLHYKPYDDIVNEAIFTFSIFPLKINIDQDTLTFLCNFFSNENLIKNNIKCNGRVVIDDVLINEIDPTFSTYFRFVEFLPSIVLHINFHGRPLSSKRNSFSDILLGFAQLASSKIVLKNLQCNGLCGWNEVITFILKSWMDDIFNNQLSSVISSIEPINHVAVLYKGLKDLIGIPIEQYKTDGRVLRGIRQGSDAFILSLFVAFNQIRSRILDILQYFAVSTYKLISCKNRKRLVAIRRKFKYKSKESKLTQDKMRSL
ncbi:hypothetical protein A3Q56_03325 [Intoshia linei]|uniref:Autophagy-related protein 2 n=1 Tax=Intoshia linei TaxID=1819745 RepID=A0A177B3U9_9BILA|nr:hypothetical protein A3Q56_03325 [Intoshia linei]